MFFFIRLTKTGTNNNVIKNYTQFRSVYVGTNSFHLVVNDLYNGKISEESQGTKVLTMIKKILELNHLSAQHFQLCSTCMYYAG